MLFETAKLAKANKARLNASYGIDPFTFNFDEKAYDLFTDSELIAAKGSVLVFDVESYVNYFIVAFKSVDSKRVVYFEDACDRTIDRGKLTWMLYNFCVVGFNSRSYDVPVITFALQGKRAPDLKDITNRIIFTNLNSWDVEREFGVKMPRVNHIDLIEVAPLQASLKLYAGRLHCQRMQELAIPHDKVLTEFEAKAVKLYCINDLDSTALLYDELKPHIALREQLSCEYNEDLRSRSDAQIAEHVIGSELKRLNGWYPKKPTIEPGTAYSYPVPSFIEYETPQLKNILEIVRNARFVIGGDGALVMPPEIEGLSVTVGKRLYKIGIGGLHSCEKQVAHKSDDEFVLIDRDVVSYYPSIILNLELFPRHLGKSFLTVYKGIVDRRVHAKQTGNKVVNESLKITINGSFGKLGNKYSILYAPDRIVSVLMTGQLSLLLLIEILEQHGFEVLSANTDGVLTKVPRARYNYFASCVIHWQNVTGFDTEETRYKAIYNRDVNNYIAIGEDGKAKVKGAYAEVGSSGKSRLSKNPEAFVCNDAVIALLKDGTPVKKTILDCKDIKRFVSIRNVKGGAEKSGVFLGRAVRWYYSKIIKGTINYVINGNKVPNTENAMPLMELLTELPPDIDHDYYCRKAEEILHEIGYYGSASEMPKLF